MSVPEAPLRTTRHGLAPDGEGWFVLNARESRWRDYGPLGLSCSFEGKRPFRQLGVNLNVLPPGAPLGLYHRERHQEGFLVLAGECLAVVEGEERRLGAWDFLHSPGGTAHVLVGAGGRGAVVVAVGARGGRKGLAYLVDETARRHGACAERETSDYREAYARFPRPVRVQAPELPDLAAPSGLLPPGPRVRSPYFGLAYVFEADGDDYPEVGYTLAVLEPAGRAASTTPRPRRRTSSSAPASAWRSSRARSARSARGTSSIARPAPSTSSSAATGLPSSS